VIPFLHSNRISLRGVHHQPAPVFHQLRGNEDLHLLSQQCEIKTWNMTTGKLKSCYELDKDKYTGFKSMNVFRGRTLLYKQSEVSGMYTYLLVELMSKNTLKEHARVCSHGYHNLYINSENTLYFAEKKGRRANTYELTRFDKTTGKIGEVIKTFNFHMPLHFLSPSFRHYIYVETHTQKVKVKDSRGDKTVCVLPSRLVQ